MQRAAQLGMGPYYQTVYNRFAKVVAGAGTHKMWIDSAHDSSVMPFIAGLQVSDGLWASYAVYTTLELYKAADNSYVVQFLYRGQAVHMPYCSDLICKWSEFAAYLQSIFPTSKPSRRISRTYLSYFCCSPFYFNG